MGLAAPDVAVKIHHHSDKVGAGHAKVGQREVDQYLPGPGANAGDADVGEDDEDGSQHGESGHQGHHDPQPLVLLPERVLAGQVGEVRHRGSDGYPGQLLGEVRGAGAELVHEQR